MATIETHKGSRGTTCRAVVRLKGHTPAYRTFRKLAAPKDWATRTEIAMPTAAMPHAPAVIILGSPNTVGHSPKARLVVTITEVRS